MKGDELFVELCFVNISLVVVNMFLVNGMIVVNDDFVVVPVCNDGCNTAKIEEELLVIVLEFLVETVLTTSDVLMISPSLGNI